MRKVSFPTVYTTGSTVDADSASAQKVLNVAATGAFTAGDRVVVNRGGVREEQAVIDSVQAGVSITLLTNLAYTHTQVQADVVEICLASLSSVLYKGNYMTMFALLLPANWTTAKITFLGCVTSDGTFNQVVKGTDAAELEIASVAASKVVGLDGVIEQTIEGIPYIKLRSGTLAAPVDQGAGDKEVTIILR
jgi:hypothetical protein